MTTMASKATAAGISLALGALLGCATSADHLTVDRPLSAAEAAALFEAARGASGVAPALANWRALILGGVQKSETLVRGARAACAVALAQPADAPGRADLARETVAWAEAALAAGPDDPPALYAHALALGLLAESST